MRSNTLDRIGWAADISWDTLEYSYRLEYAAELKLYKF